MFCNLGSRNYSGRVYDAQTCNVTLIIKQLAVQPQTIELCISLTRTNYVKSHIIYVGFIELTEFAEVCLFLFLFQFLIFIP